MRYQFVFYRVFEIHLQEDNIGEWTRKIFVSSAKFPNLEFQFN